MDNETDIRIILAVIESVGSSGRRMLHSSMMGGIIHKHLKIYVDETDMSSQPCLCFLFPLDLVIILMI